MDFTLTTYKTLLQSLQAAGYRFVTFETVQSLKFNVQGSEKESFGFGVSGLGLDQPKTRNEKQKTRDRKQETINQKPETVNEKRETIIILRHDVDLKAENSLKTAIIENELGITATYYFRIVKQSNKPEIIEKIRDLGHEIGYHYEDLSVCKGNYESAIKSFEKNLNHFRQFYPVKTICMHGSPLSKYDNRSLWEKYNYRDFGITGEPYFDIDFSEVFYLTDTGRKWDGEKVSVRDKVQGLKFKVQSSKFKVQGSEKESFGTGVSGSGLKKSTFKQETENGKQETRNGKRETTNRQPETRNVLKTSFDMIRLAERGLLPDQIMITTHPQRWTNNPLSWTKELVFQNLKNILKMVIVKRAAICHAER